MLRPSPYPNGLPKPQKLSVFEQQSKDLGLGDRFYQPPLTISFDDGLNGAGVSMRQSTGSGNECTGSNDGSKNSVLVTYLADAWTWGAEMFCGVNVTHVRRSKRGEGYLVYYSLLDGHNPKRIMWVRAVCIKSHIFVSDIMLMRLTERTSGTWRWCYRYLRDPFEIPVAWSLHVTCCRHKAFWQRGSSGVCLQLQPKGPCHWR